MRLSVLIPCFNAENYIENCLAALALERKNSEFEVICVDDGSSDDTVALLSRFASSHPWLRVIATEHGGVSHARNTALAHATGDYVWFVDADDRPASGSVARLIEVVQKTNQPDAVYFLFQRVPKDFSMVLDLDLPLGVRLTDTTPLYRRLLKSGCYNSICTMWIRRECAANTCFDESIVTGEDVLFQLNLLDYIHSFVALSEVHYLYIVEDSSCTRRFNPSKFASMRAVRMRLWAEAEKFKFERKIFARRCLDDFWNLAKLGILTSDMDSVFELAQEMSADAFFCRVRKAAGEWPSFAYVFARLADRPWFLRRFLAVAAKAAKMKRKFRR